MSHSADLPGLPQGLTLCSLFDYITQTIEINESINVLSARQMQVLDLMRTGKSNKEISLALGIFEQTVKHHVLSIMRKFRASNRTEAVYLAGVKPRKAFSNKAQPSLATVATAEKEKQQESESLHLKNKILEKISQAKMQEVDNTGVGKMSEGNYANR